MMTLLCPVAPEANDHRWDGQRRFLSQFWKPEVQNQGVKRATLHSEYQEVDLSQVPQYQVLLEPLSPLACGHIPLSTALATAELFSVCLSFLLLQKLA